MRAIWKGAVSFGLVNVPVRLFSATQEHDIRFHQVHRADGGRVKMKRTCSLDGEEISYDEIAKGYETGDGRLVILTDEDFEQLPLATGHEIDVVEFVPSEQVDPMLFGRSYYLEPDARALKPYALLREALEATDRMAVVKVALRQRESLAVLRVRDRVIVMQTLLWPDEVRRADFEVLDTDVELRPQELKMASSLIESMSADFEPDQYEDEYAKALADLVEAKLEGAPPIPTGEEETTTGRDVVDLLSALQASVERAKSSRGESAADDEATAKKPARSSGTTRKTAAKAPAKKTAKSASSSKSASSGGKSAAKSTAKKSTAKTAAKTTKPTAKTTTRTRRSA